MKNTKLYPFERNRYYSGKMLTSSDFQAEQNYFNDKRRFINNLMYGSGIVCGCGVFSLDDISLLVESGVAIDGQGREIVIESSVVRKLSSIEGFESLKTNVASLCLSYDEEEAHAVYTMNQGAATDSREYEYNRINEGYKLFLMDQEEASKQYEMEEEFLISTILFDCEDFEVKMIMPAVACRGRNVKLVVQVEKLSAEDKKLTYHAALQVPVFMTADGSQRIEVDLNDISLMKGEVLRRDYWLVTQPAIVADTVILLENGSAKAYVDGAAIEAPSGCSMKILLTNSKPRELVNREIGRMSLEMRNMENIHDFIRLADLKLVRTDNAYIIEEVIEREVKKYIVSPAQEARRTEYLEYFIKDVDILKNDKKDFSFYAEKGAQTQMPDVPEIATGVLEIPLGESAKRGDICYSGEIMHGLGKGNVYVEIGYEYISDDPMLDFGTKNTIFGNPDLFKERPVGVNAETAVKVMNDKGSFVVAAKLLEDVDYLIMTYRWVAIKFPSGNDTLLETDYSNQSISTDTPTVVLGTKESHYFQVRFNNMESCSIAYELTEPGSGEITSDGVYTAPSKEGVYEIRIYCISKPVICTYAYAVVKKKGYDNPEE